MIKGIKEVYVLMIIVIGLLFLSLYSSYGLFVSSSNNLSTISLKTELIYEFNVNSNQVLTLDSEAAVYFTMVVNNTSGTNVYYEIYSDNTNSDVLVAEVVENTTTTPTAPNTSGNLANSGRKEVPIIIINNSASTVNIKVGVSAGYTSPITYGTGIYPSGVSKITKVYALEDVPTEYCSGGEVEECEINIDNCTIVDGSISGGVYYRQYKCSTNEDVSTIPTAPTTVSYTTSGTRSYTVTVTGYYILEITGAGGGSGSPGYYSTSTTGCPGGDSGRGGYIKGRVYLTAGEVLTINVGGVGGSRSFSVTAGTAGDNGGSAGGSGTTSSNYSTGAGGGGGGYTNITVVRSGSTITLVQANGGGGGGGGGAPSTTNTGGTGGTGGGSTSGGAGGTSAGSTGVTQSNWSSCSGKTGSNGSTSKGAIVTLLASRSGAQTGAGSASITFDSYVQ